MATPAAAGGLLRDFSQLVQEQPCTVDPALQPALLDRLFSSLELLRLAKLSESASSRPLPSVPLPQPDLLELHPSHLDLRLDLGSSPTGPLSRDDSVLSMEDYGPGAAPQRQQPTPPAALLNPAPCPTIPDGSSILLPQPMPQLPQQAGPAPVLPGQLLGPLPSPGAMHPSASLPQLQVPPQAPYLSASSPQLLPGSVPPLSVLQWLQQQQWMQHQQQLMQQQQQLLQQLLQGRMEPEECLVGPEGLYQPYCNQFISPEINFLCLEILNKLKALQQEDPARGLRSKRYFCSIKEVSKVVHRARCLIVAPDVKPNFNAAIHPVKMLQQLLHSAKVHGVPIVFALSRRGIGQVFGRDKNMSVVAVMCTKYCNNEYFTLLDLATRGRRDYFLERGAAAASSI